MSAFAAFIFFWSLPLYGQSEMLQKKKYANTDFPLELTVVSNSLEPHTSDMHTYLLQVINHFDKAITAEIRTANVSCNTDNIPEVVFQQSVFLDGAENRSSDSGNAAIVTIQAKGTITFSLKLIRPVNTILNSWNCTEIKAVGEGDAVLSNSIILQTFNPDPKDFR